MGFQKGISRRMVDKQKVAKLEEPPETVHAKELKAKGDAIKNAVDYGFRTIFNTSDDFLKPAAYKSRACPPTMFPDRNTLISKKQASDNIINLLGNTLWTFRNTILPEVYNLIEDRPVGTADDPIAQKFADLELPITLKAQDLLRIVLYYDLKLIPEAKQTISIGQNKDDHHKKEEVQMLAKYKLFRESIFLNLRAELAAQFPCHPQITSDKKLNKNERRKVTEHEGYANVILQRVIGQDSDMYVDGVLEQAEKWRFGYDVETKEWWKEGFVKNASESAPEHELPAELDGLMDCGEPMELDVELLIMRSALTHCEK